MSRHWYEIMLAVALLVAEQAMGKLLPSVWPDEFSWLAAAAAGFLFVLGVWGLGRDAYRQRQIAFVPDLHPKDLARYLCDAAKWSERFNDKLAWFGATKLALRDELRQGRRLKAHGRPSGKWADGSFRHPSDFIEREFWIRGDLNWMRIINADYEGDIDAYDRGYGEQPKKSYDDVMFCRREVEAVWPKRSRLRRWLKPIPFEPFEVPPYGPEPTNDDAPNVTLLEAATRAFEKTRAEPVGAFAQHEGDPKRVLLWYCHALAQRLRFIGSRAPSRELETLPEDVTDTHAFAMAEDGIVLRERGGGGVINNVQVKEADLTGAIDQIRQWGRAPSKG